jgi:hypothetical protein
MGRRILMVLLGIGAIAGFASGFHHLGYGGYCRFDHAGHEGRQGAFERRVADTCAESALRVYNRQSPPGPKP